jgi:hypothetical protein
VKGVKEPIGFSLTFFCKKSEKDIEIKIIMNVTRDTLLLILSLLPAKDALALRATCKVMNHMVSHSQLYWFYQYKARYGRKGSRYRPSDVESASIAGRKAVHVKPFTRHCFDRIHEIPQESMEELILLEPTVTQEMDDLRTEILDTYPYRHGYPGEIPEYWIRCVEYRVRREVFRKHRDLASSITSFQAQCHHSDHVEVAFDKIPQVGLETKDFQRDSDGLYLYQFLYLCYDEMRMELKRKTNEHHDMASKRIHDQIEVLEQKISELKHDIWVHSNFEKLEEDMTASPFFRKRNRMKEYHKRPEVMRCFGQGEPSKVPRATRAIRVTKKSKDKKSD